MVDHNKDNSGDSYQRFSLTRCFTQAQASTSWYIFMVSKLFTDVMIPFIQRNHHKIQQEPYTMTRGSELEGFCIDLLSQLSEIIGFRYTLQLVKDGRYGSVDASGNWNGMIGEIVRGVSFGRCSVCVCVGVVCVCINRPNSTLEKTHFDFPFISCSPITVP